MPPPAPSERPRVWPLLGGMLGVAHVLAPAPFRETAHRAPRHGAGRQRTRQPGAAASVGQTRASTPRGVARGAISADG